MTRELPFLEYGKKSGFGGVVTRAVHGIQSTTSAQPPTLVIRRPAQEILSNMRLGSIP